MEDSRLQKKTALFYQELHVNPYFVSSFCKIILNIYF